MFRRLVSLAVLAWLLGFLWFAVALPMPRDGGKTDGVIVLTGGGGRIGRGLEALSKGWARRMLVSGVDREVKPHEFAAEYHVAPGLMQCCITLGFDSTDTRSNANEAARWIAANKFKSVRLITNDWHMRRARYELARVMPRGVTVVPDAIRSHSSFETLVVEYHKLLARWAARAWGG
ncbi:MAG: YdcF family protein [Novosphingobium sp.]